MVSFSGPGWGCVVPVTHLCRIPLGSFAYIMGGQGTAKQ